MAKQVIFYNSNFLNKLACTTNTVPTTTTTTTTTMQVNPKIDLPQFKVDTTFNDNWSVLTYIIIHEHLSQELCFGPLTNPGT